MPNIIIDAHHHLWSLQGDVTYPWLQERYDAKKFFLGDYTSLCQDFNVDAFAKIIGKLPVVATVHIEAECSRTDALKETAWLHSLAQLQQSITSKNTVPKIPAAIVAWVDLLADDAEERLIEHLQYPLVKGIRFKPRTSESQYHTLSGSYTLTDTRWAKGLELLNQYNLIWDLRVPFWHLAETAKLLQDSPSINVVLEHTGLPWDRSESGLLKWQQGMMALAEFSNVSVKLSEFSVQDRLWDENENRRIIKDTIEIFGANRCMFASNFPVAGLRVSYKALVELVESAIKEANLDAIDSHAIWYENANQIYGLNLPF